MRAPSINLARRPFRNNTIHHSVFGACGLVLLAATALNVHDFFGRGAELRALRTDLEAATQRYAQLHQEVERMKKDIASVNLALLNEKSAFVNGLILSRLFSWSLLFDRLEELLPIDAKIRSIRPSISSKQIEIQIDGMARTAADLYEFEASLGGSDFFSSVYPVSENTRESKTEINFDLAMNYIPAGKSASTPSPPTPTAGLPGAGADEEVAGEAASPEEAREDRGIASGGEDAEGGDGGEPGQEPPDGVARPSRAAGATGLAPGSARPPSEAETVGSQPPLAPAQEGGAGSAGAPPATRPLVGMSNRDFYDKRGEEIFLRVRGPLVPVEPDAHPGMTNGEYIEQFGMEKFMEARGHLTGPQQARRAAPPAAGPPPERTP